MTTNKHKRVDKVSLERIVNWPFSFKLSLKIFVILFVLAHFIYIDSINNHISNHYKRKWVTITGYLRGSTLHMSSKYFSLLHWSLQDSWFWLHHSQGHQSHHPLSKSTVYQICVLKKKKHIERPALKALKSVYNRWVVSYLLGWFAFWPWILAKPGHIWSWSILGGEQGQPCHRRLSTIWIWT